MLAREEVRTAFLLKLRASALDEKDVKTLSFQPFTAEEVAAKPKLQVSAPAAGFVLPYYDAERNYTDFFRFRYLEQPARNGFAALAAHKELRYTQPPGLKPRVYFCPLFPWEELLARKEPQEFFITEGELKAACACKHGYPTLALGGVWNFRAKDANQPLIPDLAELNIKDWRVYIVYDSDAVSNVDILAAENALARQLLKAQALPYILRLPALPHFKKTGLDDYLVARGPKSFDKLKDKATFWADAAALHEFNEEVLFLRESNTVLDLNKRHRWRAQEAVSSVFLNRTYTVTEYKKKEAVMVEKRTASEWLKWEGRGQLETVTYRPGEPPIVDNCWNGWRGWGLTEEQVRRGDIMLWRELLDFIFAGHDPLHKKWFEQWLAYPLQHPGAKLFTASVLWGLPGTGKTLIGHTLARIYGENYTEVNERELHGSFNEWAEYKQFALGDEITGGDKRAVSDFLKGLITQKFLRINPKHIKPFTLPDCMNWLFTSNHCDAFFIEDDDRRYFVIEIKGRPKDRAFYRAYDEWYKSAAVGALFHHLLHLDMKGFDPMDPAPTTSSKQEMIDDGRSDLAAWCTALKRDPDAILKVNGGGPIARTLWTSGELFALYDPDKRGRVTEQGLGRELKRQGFKKVLDGAPIRTARGLAKLWMARPLTEQWKKPLQYATLYDQQLGLVRPPDGRKNNGLQRKREGL